MNMKKFIQIIDNSSEIDNSAMNIIRNISLFESKEKVNKKILSDKPQNKLYRTKHPQHYVSGRHARKKNSITRTETKGVPSNNQSNVQCFQTCSADLSITDMIEKSFNEDSIDTSSNITFVSSPSNIKQVEECSALDASSPWRVCTSSTRKAHTFIVKDKSFIPSYDQDMIIDSNACNNAADSSTVKYPNQQTNLLAYVNDTKQNFKSTLFISPRKTQDEINPKQLSQPQLELNTGCETEGGQVGLFGFSSDENEENCDPVATFTARSKKKKTLVHRAMLKDQPAVDGEYPERSNGHERTKEEEEQLDKLAAHYNSMFEEIDQHALHFDS